MLDDLAPGLDLEAAEETSVPLESTPSLFNRFWRRPTTPASNANGQQRILQSEAHIATVPTWSARRVTMVRWTRTPVSIVWLGLKSIAAALLLCLGSILHLVLAQWLLFVVIGVIIYIISVLGLYR
jgi:hypothetical protein